MNKQSGIRNVRILALALMTAGTLFPQMATASQSGADMSQAASLLGPVTSTFGSASSGDSLPSIAPSTQDLKKKLRALEAKVTDDAQELEARDKNREINDETEAFQDKSNKVDLAKAKITAQRADKNKAAALAARNAAAPTDAVGPNNLNFDGIDPWCAEADEGASDAVKELARAMSHGSINQLRQGASKFSSAEKKERAALIAQLGELKKKLREAKKERNGEEEDSSHDSLLAKKFQVGNPEFESAKRIAKLKAARAGLEEERDHAETVYDEAVTGENGLLSFLQKGLENDDALFEMLDPFVQNFKRYYKETKTKVLQSAKNQYEVCESKLGKMGRSGTHGPGEMKDAYDKTQKMYAGNLQQNAAKRQEYREEFGRLQQELSCYNAKAKAEAQLNGSVEDEADKLYGITEPDQLIRSALALVDNTNSKLKKAVEETDRGIKSCDKIAKKSRRVKEIAGDMKKVQEEQFASAGFPDGLRGQRGPVGRPGMGMPGQFGPQMPQGPMGFGGMPNHF